MEVRKLIHLGNGFSLVDLLHGRYSIIDTSDAGLVDRYNWVAALMRCGAYYAVTNEPRTEGKKRKNIRMHRLIMGVTDPKVQVDHKNHATLDNRRSCNLRLVSNGHNQYNRVLQGGASQYKGVSWNKQCQQWQAYICRYGQQFHLGLFDEEEDAARAYDTAAITFGGPVLLNFPLQPHQEAA